MECGVPPVVIAAQVVTELVGVRVVVQTARFRDRVPEHVAGDQVPVEVSGGAGDGGSK